MYNLLVFLSFLQSVLGFTLMSSSTIRFRKPVKLRMLAGFLAMLLGILLLSYTLYSKGSQAVDGFVILVILAIPLSWFLICAEDRFFVSLFSFLTYINIYVAISYISDNVAMPLANGSAYVVARMLIRLLIYALILPMLFRTVRPRFRILVDALDEEWKSATLVPLMSLIVQVTVLYYPSPYWRWTEGSWNSVIIGTVYLLFFAVYYLFYIQASAIVEKYTLEKRQLLMAQQEKLWESELVRQKATAAMAFQQRHDMRHHNGVVLDLLHRGETDRLKEYMRSYDAALSARDSRAFCTNPIANSIISLYAKRASEQNIKTTFDAHVPASMGIDNVDLTCVLGNALENALEGCLRMPEDVEKEIVVTMKYVDHRLRVMVDNTCSDDVEFQGELPVTQKAGGGTGTKSILYTAERYDGTAGFSVVGGRFITRVVLNAN